MQSYKFFLKYFFKTNCFICFQARMRACRVTCTRTSLEMLFLFLIFFIRGGCAGSQVFIYFYLFSGEEEGVQGYKYTCEPGDVDWTPMNSNLHMQSIKVFCGCCIKYC